MANIVIGITLVVLMLVERANSRCVSSGQECSREIRCCLQRDTCVTSRQERDGSLVTRVFCRDVRRQQKNGARLLADGNLCNDSIQCQNMCCREYRAAGLGERKICGNQGDSIIKAHTCFTSLP